MKHIFLILGMLLSASQVFGQKQVGSLPLKIEGDAQAYHIADPLLAINYLLINDKDYSTFYKLDSKLVVQDSIREVKIDSKYKKNAGSIQEGNSPVLFWSNSNSSTYVSQKFDFSEHKFSIHEFDINLKKEKILCQFTALNQMFVLTVLENSSLIKVYKFTDSKTLRTQIINLGSYIFFDKDYKKQNLDELLKYSFTLEKMGYEPYELDKIDNTSPTPITLVTNKKKFYVEDQILTITLDHHSDFTELIRINLENYSIEKLQLKKPFIASTSRYELNSNSFILKNHIAQIKTSTQTLFVTVKDLEGNLLKEYTTNQKGDLNFITEQPSNKNGKENAASFLKLLKYDRIATTFYTYRDGYVINIGAVHPRDVKSGLRADTPVDLAGGLIYSAYNNYIANPILDKFRGYSNKHSTLASILTDKDFNAIPGNIQPSVYQKIQNYISTRKFMSKAEILFEQHQKMYMGYFDLQTNRYNFLEFE